MKLIFAIVAVLYAVAMSSCETISTKDDHGHEGHDHSSHAGHDHSSHAGHDHSSHGASDDDFDALEKALEE